MTESFSEFYSKFQCYPQDRKNVIMCMYMFKNLTKKFQMLNEIKNLKRQVKHLLKMIQKLEEEVEAC